MNDDDLDTVLANLVKAALDVRSRWRAGGQEVLAAGRPRGVSDPLARRSGRVESAGRLAPQTLKLRPVPGDCATLADLVLILDVRLRSGEPIPNRWRGT